MICHNSLSSETIKYVEVLNGEYLGGCINTKQDEFCRLYLKPYGNNVSICFNGICKNYTLEKEDYNYEIDKNTVNVPGCIRLKNTGNTPIWNINLKMDNITSKYLIVYMKNISNGYDKTYDGDGKVLPYNVFGKSDLDPQTVFTPGYVLCSNESVEICFDIDKFKYMIDRYNRKVDEIKEGNITILNTTLKLLFNDLQYTVDEDQEPLNYWLITNFESSEGSSIVYGTVRVPLVRTLLNSSYKLLNYFDYKSGDLSEVKGDGYSFNSKEDSNGIGKNSFGICVGDTGVCSLKVKEPEDKITKDICSCINITNETPDETRILFDSKNFTFEFTSNQTAEMASLAMTLQVF